MNDVQAQMWNSAFDFERVVWPTIAAWVGGGYLECVEGNAPEDLAKALDVFAGIDGFQVVQGQGMRGIASRVQYGRTPRKSFTIRLKTAAGGPSEFDKRITALKDPQGRWLLPMWTVQAYVERPRTGALLYACAVRTEDLFNYVSTKRDETLTRTNYNDGSEFLVCWAQDIKASGFQVFEHEPFAGSLSAIDGSKASAYYREAVMSGEILCEDCNNPLQGWYECLPCGGVANVADIGTDQALCTCGRTTIWRELCPQCDGDPDQCQFCGVETVWPGQTCPSCGMQWIP